MQMLAFTPDFAACLRPNLCDRDYQCLPALFAFKDARDALKPFKVKRFRDAAMAGRNDRGAGLLVEYVRCNG
jgi:hypothetical protein